MCGKNAGLLNIRPGGIYAYFKRLIFDTCLKKYVGYQLRKRSHHVFRLKVLSISLSTFPLTYTSYLSQQTPVDVPEYYQPFVVPLLSILLTFLPADTKYVHMSNIFFSAKASTVAL
jgi:hypothetical protein